MKGLLTALSVCFLYAGMFYYICYRLLYLFNFHPSKWIILSTVLILSIISSCTTWYAGNNKLFIILGTFGSWSLVLIFLLFIFLLIEHFISIWFKINPRIIIGTIFIILGIGSYFSLHTTVRYLDIQSEKIQDDIKILLVSDIHSDYIFSQYHLKTIGKIINKEHPNFVIIAGDLINRPFSDYVKAYNYFQDNQFSVPIFSIIGNHDVLGNTGMIQELTKISSIHFLNNETVNIDNIQLVGIVDKSIRGTQSLDTILEQSGIDKDSKNFTILATHQPISLKKLEQYPIDLEVAGHTHRGQIYGFRKIVEWLNDYGYGKYQHNGKTVFVTQGIGTRGLPVRLGTQSEIVVINLSGNI